ncbi:MAG: hypothetical protein AB8D78_00075 [Akkermansiaceae bacterium]
MLATTPRTEKFDDCRMGLVIHARRVIRMEPIVIALCISAGFCFAEPEDWRIQLLEEAGLSLEEAKKKFLGNNEESSEEELRKLVSLLAADDFATRAKSQTQIESMGSTVIPLLNQFRENDDPEIRFRLEQILDKLSGDRIWEKDRLLTYATKSLSEEAQPGGQKAKEQTLFVESFQDVVDPIGQSYRHFDFVRDKGLNAKATNGVLTISGKNKQQGDQRILLEAEKITGKKTFPNQFNLEVATKTTPGGEGIFHTGVAVGNLRALFHPGYRGGGFRFERVDTKEDLKSNTNMGFTPKVGQFHTIQIQVKRLSDDQFQVVATVHSKTEAKPFEATIKISEKVIGDLTTIGLDRSGNPGGDAIFDDLVIDLDP